MKRKTGYLAAVLAAFVVACAGQGVKMSVEMDSPTCGTKKIDFRTDYQVEQLDITRGIEGGGEDAGGGSEGCGGDYSVTLGKGTTRGTDPELWAFLGVLVDRLSTLQGIPLGDRSPGTEAEILALREEMRDLHRALIAAQAEKFAED